MSGRAIVYDTAPITGKKMISTDQPAFAQPPWSCLRKLSTSSMTTHQKNISHAKKTIIVHIASQNVYAPRTIGAPFGSNGTTLRPRRGRSHPPRSVHPSEAAAAPARGGGTHSPVRCVTRVTWCKRTQNTRQQTNKRNKTAAVA